MKYLFTPLTAGLFLLFNCATIYLFIWVAGYFYSFTWFWFVLSYGLIGVVIFTLGHGCLVSSIKFFMNFYEYNLISRITHSLFALAGVVIIGYFYTQHPPMLEGPEGQKFILTTMWETAPYKAIIAIFFTTAIILANTYLTVIETLTKVKIQAFYDVRLLKDYTSF
ncbi:hypothetical protein AAKU52_001296 [Pedobacter sp. CG_S7]|uniref:hypothetical protein n=1 Tax=Pedobacter sp. CG_S7 TaxID=3143930 RepID=UPI00339830C6